MKKILICILLIVFLYNSAFSQKFWFIFFADTSQNSVGHGFVSFIKQDPIVKQTILDGCWGLYPVSDSKIQIVKSIISPIPGRLLPDISRQRSLGFMIEVSKQEYLAGMQTKNEWMQKPYSVLYQNCKDFIYAVAQNIKNKAFRQPSAFHRLPSDYIKDLKLLNSQLEVKGPLLVPEISNIFFISTPFRKSSYSGYNIINVNNQSTTSIDILNIVPQNCRLIAVEGDTKFSSGSLFAYNSYDDITEEKLMSLVKGKISMQSNYEYVYNKEGKKTKITVTSIWGADSKSKSVQEYTFSYDSTGNIIKASRKYDRVPQFDRFENYTYDSLNRLVSIKDYKKNSSVQEWKYGEDGKLTSITNKEGVAIFSYDSQGREIEVSRNEKIIGRRVYDTEGRIIEEKGLYNINENIDVPYSLQYKYDDTGKLLYVYNGNELIEYQYDNTNQLVGAKKYYVGNSISNYQSKQPSETFDINSVTHTVVNKQFYDNPVNIIYKYSCKE